MIETCGGGKVLGAPRRSQAGPKMRSAVLCAAAILLCLGAAHIQVSRKVFGMRAPSSPRRRRRRRKRRRGKERRRWRGSPCVPGTRSVQTDCPPTRSVLTYCPPRAHATAAGAHARVPAQHARVRADAGARRAGCYGCARVRLRSHPPRGRPALGLGGPVGGCPGSGCISRR
jgi:hypothetical protein